MTDLFFALVSDWGAPALAVATFLSCLAVPVPTSLMMLAAGAFAASGDLSLAAVVTAALVGAVVGDQAGFGIGRGGGALVAGRLARRPGTARLLAEARRTLAARGALTVFLTRWLFSPLGPYVNFVAGGAGMAWPRFAAMSVAGETVWVAVYVGTGYAFGTQLAEIGRLLTDIVGLLTSALLVGVTGVLLWRRRRRR